MRFIQDERIIELEGIVGSPNIQTVYYWIPIGVDD